MGSLVEISLFENSSGGRSIICHHGQHRPPPTQLGSNIFMIVSERSETIMHPYLQNSGLLRAENQFFYVIEF